MAEDEWVKAAMMGDDSMVAELLIRIKHSEPKIQKKKKMPSTMTILEWGLRQPRSRQILMRCSTTNNNNNNNNNNTVVVVQMNKKKKKGGGCESSRASPTTPLSWSGGGGGGGGGGGSSSLSGGGGGGGGCEDGIGISGGCGGDVYEEEEEEEEESSRPMKRPSGGGSNNKVVTGTNERAIRRRSRKKKTFAQLKEEESLLLKERIHLKKELATLRNTCEEQKAINNKLKRMKLDCQSQSSTQLSRAGDVSKEGGIYDQSCQMENIPSTIIFRPTSSTFNGMDDSAICSPSLPPDLCTEQQMDTVVVRESLFELPDLNLPLEEEDSSTEVLYGMS